MARKKTIQRNPNGMCGRGRGGSGDCRRGRSCTREQSKKEKGLQFFIATKTPSLLSAAAGERQGQLPSSSDLRASSPTHQSLHFHKQMHGL